MTNALPLITRADLAKALDELVHDDPRLAGVLAMCEAWEPGYVATLIVHAEVLVGNGLADRATETSLDERARLAVRQAVETANPRQRVERAGATPTTEAVDALIRMLGSRAHFHETTGELERRGIRREPPTG